MGLSELMRMIIIFVTFCLSKNNNKKNNNKKIKSKPKPRKNHLSRKR